MHPSLTFGYFIYVGMAEMTPYNYFQRLLLRFFVDVR